MTGEHSNEGFQSTEGLTLLWELTAQPDNIVFHSPEAELEGMRYLHGAYRWPAVYGFSGTITVTVPRAGTYYPSVVVYDRWDPLTLYGMEPLDIPPGRPSFEMSVEGKVLGRFALQHNDRRQRLFFLDPPVEFKGGERITIRTGPTGSHVVEDILLLRRRPPRRDREYSVTQVKSDFVEREGQACMRLTWITSWSAQCTVEWGSSVEYGNKVTEDEPLANHRIFLTGLKPGGVCHYRIVAPRPDGASIATLDRTFTFLADPPFESEVERAEVPLRAENPCDFSVEGHPVTSGIPFPAGQLGEAEHLRLLDADGKELALQAEVTGRWQDGSVKWVVLTFFANVKASDAATYTLEYGTKVQRSPSATPLAVERNEERVAVHTGPLRVEFDSKLSGFPVRAELEGREVLNRSMEAVVVDGEGTVSTSDCTAELLEVEEAGPNRVVLHSRGHHRSAEGRPFFEYEARFVFYANAPFFRLQYAWGNDREELFSHFRNVSLQIPLAGDKELQWSLGLGEGQQKRGRGDMELRQLRHDSFELQSAQPAGASQSRADGWIDVGQSEGGVMIAVRDFWELYPRSLALKDGVLEAGLAAEFPTGYYEQAEQKDLINLYFHLQGDSYKVKQGVKKWHDLMLLFHTEGPGQLQNAQAAVLFEEPLIAVCPPEWYCGTGVFGLVLPAGSSGAKRYDELCEVTYKNYVDRRDAEAWYGQLNFGDLLGENLVSWLNNEYDNAHSFFLQFARTGDRRWYFLGEKVARHAMDVDVCHYGERTGAEWAHALGHTGDYFSGDPYGLTRFDGYGSGNLYEGVHAVCHAWVGGMHDWYYLSGDRTALETLSLVADYSCRSSYLNDYEWFATREAGWQLILLLTAYQASSDPYYLNAGRLIVESVLEHQTPGPRGWHHQMVPAHCYCTPRHRGEASYMIGVLATGLEIYYDITADARAAEAIVGGANQVIDEMWVEEHGVFRATSCPNTTWATDEEMKEKAPLYISNVSQMLLFAYARTGCETYRDIAEKAMRKTFNARGLYLQHMYWVPRVLYYMAHHSTLPQLHVLEEPECPEGKSNASR